MKIDDLILYLQAIRNEHGNIDVRLVGRGYLVDNHFELNTNESEHVLDEFGNLELQLIYVDTTSQHSDLEKAGY